MLKSFRLKNFKAHKDSDLEMGRITVLIGPQDSGKSSVLQALQLLKQTSGGENLSFEGRFEDLEYSDIIHQGKDRLQLTFGIELQCVGAPAFMSETGEYRVTYDVNFQNATLKDHRASYQIGNTNWEFHTPNPGRWSVPDDFQLPDRPSVKFYGSTYALLPFTYKVPSQDYALHRGIGDLRLTVSDFFREFQMVPEGRIVMNNIYPFADASATGPPSINQMISKAAREWGIRDELSAYLKRAVGRRINFEGIREGVMVEVAGGPAGSRKVMCEGGGVRGLIWPLGAIAAAQPGTLVAIEEPEIHLHPKALGHLSQLFIDVSKEKELQLLLTSHSEHLLFSLLTAVAKGDFKAEDLRIHYCEETDGCVTVRPLEVDSRGQISGGLPGFFEATLDEFGGFLSALKDAGSRG